MAPAGAGARRLAARAARCCGRAGLALLVLGGADYGLQRWRLMKSLKMTRAGSPRRSAKSSEGSPEIKARVRKMQRDMIAARMLHAPSSTRPSSSPTRRTIAVALEYRRETMAAPVVVAKGQDLMAQRIREIAREHGVPIVENVALARALFKGAEVGDTIPGRAVRRRRRSARVPRPHQAVDALKDYDAPSTALRVPPRDATCSRRPPSWRSCC